MITRLQDITLDYMIIQFYFIQLTMSNINILKPIKLKPMKSISLLPLLNINFFNLVTFQSIKKSEITKLENETKI